MLRISQCIQWWQHEHGINGQGIQDDRGQPPEEAYPYKAG